jgi:hypothetical protein
MQINPIMSTNIEFEHHTESTGDNFIIIIIVIIVLFRVSLD